VTKHAPFLGKNEEECSLQVIDSQLLSKVEVVHECGSRVKAEELKTASVGSKLVLFVEILSF
jgi:hypothetical protein